MIKYDDIFAFSNLYKAHLKSRRCKRHKKDVITFEIDLSNNLYKLYKELKRRTYKISDYNHFTIIEPKKRVIQALHYKDRVVQHVIVDNY